MWLIPNCPSLPCARAAADSSADLAWRSQLLAQFVGWSGTPSPPTTYATKWKQGGWIRRLFGRICEPSTAQHGVDAWISSLRGIRASRSAKPVDVMAMTIRGTCGPRFIESCRRHVLPSSFWKTSQGTLALGWEPSSEISTEQATELRRLSSKLQQSVRHTNGNGSSSSQWATITASQQNNSNREKWTTIPIHRQVERWRSPTAEASEEPGNRNKPGRDDPTLNSQERTWATPTEDDMSNVTAERDYKSLAQDANKWPTPDGSVMNDGENPETFEQRRLELQSKGINGNGAGTPLTQAAQGFSLQAQETPLDGLPSSPDGPTSRQQWTTPQAHDVTERGSGQQPTAKAGNACLARDARAGSQTKRLNPLFVFWLMAWDLDATCFDWPGTESSPSKPLWRSVLLRLVSE